MQHGEHETALNSSGHIDKILILLIVAIPFVSTIAFGAVDPLASSFLSILSAVIIVLWIAKSLRTGAVRFSADALQLPLIGLLLIGCIQLLPFGDSGLAPGLLSISPTNSISLDPYSTRIFIGRLIIYLIFFAAALAYVNTQSRANKIAVAIIVFGSLVAFFAILQRLANPEGIYGIRPTPQAIPFGPFVNQHHFAALMVMISGVVLGLLFGRGTTRDKKLLLAIAAVLLGITIVLTGSRGALISYAGVVLFTTFAGFAWTRKNPREIERKRVRLAALAGIAGLIFILAGAVLFLGGGDSLIRGIGLQESQTDFTSGRKHFWSVAMKIFLDHPVLGAGFDAFAVAFSRYDTWPGILRVEQAHNDYLQTLADAGVVGFFFVAVFVFLLVRKGLRAISNAGKGIGRDVAVGAFAGCIGILIHSFLDFPLRTPANAFFFLLLAVLAIAVFPKSAHRPTAL